MSMSRRIVHLKQSGELLTDVPGERWTPTALAKAAARIAEVQQHADELGVAGLMIVSGGGNAPDGFGRGAELRAKFGADSPIAEYADVIGRRSTIDNAIMLSAYLQAAAVPHKLMAAPSSSFSDQDLGIVPAYDDSLVQQAYADGKVVLMAGGTGKSNQTTDTGVVELAMWQAQAHPEIPSLAFKMTKYNGVFDADPATNPEAKRYARLSADFMLTDYDRFSAVDKQCLEVLKQAGDKGLDVQLQVYAAEYSIVEALQDEQLGTRIYSKACVPTYR